MPLNYFNESVESRKAFILLHKEYYQMLQIIDRKIFVYNLNNPVLKWKCDCNGKKCKQFRISNVLSYE
jgi:hypothetical protein